MRVRPIAWPKAMRRRRRRAARPLQPIDRAEVEPGRDVRRRTPRVEGGSFPVWDEIVERAIVRGVGGQRHGRLGRPAAALISFVSPAPRLREENHTATVQRSVPSRPDGPAEKSVHAHLARVGSAVADFHEPPAQIEGVRGHVVPSSIGSIKTSTESRPTGSTPRPRGRACCARPRGQAARRSRGGDQPVAHRRRAPRAAPIEAWTDLGPPARSRPTMVTGPSVMTGGLTRERALRSCPCPGRPVPWPVWMAGWLGERGAAVTQAGAAPPRPPQRARHRPARPTPRARSRRSRGRSPDGRGRRAGPWP